MQLSSRKIYLKSFKFTWNVYLNIVFRSFKLELPFLTIFLMTIDEWLNTIDKFSNQLSTAVNSSISIRFDLFQREKTSQLVVRYALKGWISFFKTLSYFLMFSKQICWYSQEQRLEVCSHPFFFFEKLQQKNLDFT